MCKTLLSPYDDWSPEKEVGNTISDCDLYLVDVVTNKILTNKNYRVIHPKLGKAILGKSDAQGKIPRDFKLAHVEVLPVLNKSYLDDSITAPVNKLVKQALWKLIEVKKDLQVNANTSINITAPLPIMNGINKPYMDWLRDEQNNDPWPEYNNAVKAPYRYSRKYVRASESEIKSVIFTGSPSVPKGSILVNVDDLMGGFHCKNKNYSYLNLMANSKKPGDVNISGCFMHHINNGNLPEQYFYVLGHGSPSILQEVDSSGMNINYLKNSLRNLDLLKGKIESNGYTTDKTIVFLACHLGNGANSFAEEFSKLPGIGTVYAFTGFGWFGGTGKFNSAGGYTVEYQVSNMKSADKKLIPTDKVIGHWRIFNTATAAIKP